jgi:hypothetical protein
MQRIVILLGLLIFSQGIWADFNGTMDDNGDGTYTVKLDNTSGHQYTGMAIPQKDGTLSVNVHDHNDNYLSGEGRATDSHQIDLNLQNDATGRMVEGRIVEN